MKIVKLISFDSYFFNKGKFKSISTEDKIDSENRYLIYMDDQLAGSVSVADDEIKKITLKVGKDEKYLIKKTVRLLEKCASDKKMIRFYIYSDTKHVEILEKMGFIKRKRFFDKHDGKYFLCSK